MGRFERYLGLKGTKRNVLDSEKRVQRKIGITELVKFNVKS